LKYLENYPLPSLLFQEIFSILKKNYTRVKKISGERSFEVYQNSLQGYDEVVKRLWEIIDSSKTDEKEKIKAINLIMQYCKEKLK
jgi:hypothetical protein